MTSLFLDGFEGAYEQIRSSRAATKAPKRTLLPARPPRRRARVDRGTPLSLNLTEGERKVVDTCATELAMSRSALVSEVLELILQGRQHQQTRRRQPS